MISISRVKKATKDFIKVLRFGKSDVVTANQFGGAGIDSKPVSSDLALYAKTSGQNEPVILGYLNNSDKTAEGEIRIFSRDENGNEVFSMLFKNDGTVEFGGNSSNLVRYAELNTGLQNQKTLINAELAKISAALLSVGGIYTVLPINVDISASKIDEIKSL